MAYDLPPLAAPRSSGGLLKLFVALAEGPLGGPLAKKFLNDIGVGRLRAATPDDALPAEHGLLVDARRAAPGEAPTEADLGDSPAAIESVQRYEAAYRSGATTPSDVAERLIEAIQASNAGDRPLRAVIAHDIDDLMRQATASAARWAEGAPLGPLDGVPIGVKDELWQRGYPTGVGTAFLADGPAAEDATVVARLRAQGALLFGKLNMHELGMGVTGINPHWGSARNPHDRGRCTGGSSSGPGAAVGFGLGPIAVGADGGGSIRIPAALCGVVGLKATFGRVSEHGAFPLCWSVAHVGPLAATVRDAAIAYQVMAGPDPHDHNSDAQPPVALESLTRQRLDGVRLGVFRPWFEHAEPAVVEACDAAVKRLVARGAEVVPVEIPDLDLLRSAHLVTITSEMTTSLDRYYATHRKRLGHDIRLNVALAHRMTGRDYVQAQRLRPLFLRHFQRAFATCDAIVTPATSCVAPPMPDKALRTGLSDLALVDAIMRFAPAANLTGLPAISVPCGARDGLPIGLQFMGPAWSEARLLALAAVVERDTPPLQAAERVRLLPE